MTSSSENERSRLDDASDKRAVDTCCTHFSLNTRSNVIQRGVDPITDKTLHDLFPQERTAWGAFLDGIVRHATIESSDAWAHMVLFPEEGDVAVLYCSGVKDLSQKLHQAYATTHLYYTLFRAIEVVHIIEYKEQNHKRLIILLPFSSYHLPTDLPERLERMKMRSKNKNVHHLINRILSHRSRLARQETTVQPNRRQESLRDNRQEVTLHTIQQILSSEGVEDQDSRIAARIIAEMNYFASEGVVDSFAIVPIDEKRQYQVAQMSDIAEDTGGGDLASQRVHNLQSSQLQESDHQQYKSSAASTVRGANTSIATNLLASDMQRDSHLSVTNLLASDTQRDSYPSVSINGNGYSILAIPSDSVNDAALTQQERQDGTKIPEVTDVLSVEEICGHATALALLVEGRTRNVGAFITLLRRYSPEVVRAAVIATLVRKHFPYGLGPLNRPGGYCTRRCQEYTKTGIPDRIIAFLDTYESLSCQEIDCVLHKQAQEQRVGYRQAVPEGVVNDSQDLPTPKRGIWMNRQTAEALATRILQEAPEARIAGVRDVQQGQGTVSVVDAFVEETPWTIASLEDWVDHITTIRQLESSSRTEWEQGYE